MQLDEDVHVSEYRVEWARWFSEEQDRLSDVLRLVPENIEHIGSTAVVGMLAKPIVDIMAGFVDFPPPPLMIQKLAGRGYEFFGEAGVPGRLYLRRRGAESINLHLVDKGGSHWINNIALREYLRGSATARERYRTAKSMALAGGSTTLLEYSKAKSEFLRALLDEAIARRGRLPDDTGH